MQNRVKKKQIGVQLSISNNICHFTLKQICDKLISFVGLTDLSWRLETDLIINIFDIVHTIQTNLWSFHGGTEALVG